MAELKKKILIVDDELKIVEAVKAYLEKNGYETVEAFDGNQALDMFEKTYPDMVILDLMLPGKPGEEVCRAIRRISRVPIIMLTAKIDEDEKINGLNIGADDYVTKPFSIRELMARVDSLFRRADEGFSPLFHIMSWNEGDLEINMNSMTVKKAGKDAGLTPNEFKILCALMKYPQKIFTRDELIETALGFDYDGFHRTVDSHVKNLRSKIEDDTTNPKYVLTVRGIGYKFGENK